MPRACWQNYVLFPSNFLKRVWTRAFSLWGLMVGLLSSKYHKKDKKWTKELISTQPPFLPFTFSLLVQRSDSWQLGFKKFHPALYPTPDLTVKSTAPAWLWWSHREELLTMGSLRRSADCVHPRGSMLWLAADHRFQFYLRSPHFLRGPLDSRAMDNIVEDHVSLLRDRHTGQVPPRVMMFSACHTVRMPGDIETSQWVSLLHCILPNKRTQNIRHILYRSPLFAERGLFNRLRDPEFLESEGLLWWRGLHGKLVSETKSLWR